MDLWGQSVSLEELKSHLECPVCFNLCRAPPIYQCSAGHMLCSSCHDRVEFCPMCRLPLDSRRLLFAEKLLERLPQKCKFMNQGCDFEDFSSKVQIHEKRCVYAPIECKYTKFGCDVVLVKTAITHHENNCDFITTKCPIQNCTVSDVVMCRLSDHLDAVHVKRDYRVVTALLFCFIFSLGLNIMMVLMSMVDVESIFKIITLNDKEEYTLVVLVLSILMVKFDVSLYILVLGCFLFVNSLMILFKYAKYYYYSM